MTYRSKSILVVATVVFAIAATASPSEGDRRSLALPDGVTLDLVWIPAGEFRMGQNPGEQDAYSNKESPQHTVRMTRGFWIGTCEVTKEQWYAVMHTRPWAGRDYVTDDARTPAVYLSWDDAAAFSAELTRLAGEPARLPTEAEWEYACRAGTTTRFYWGDDPRYEDIETRAWWRGNSMLTDAPAARPVATMPPNPWGLHDMSGNVSEWCQDWHWFYFDGIVTNPVGPTFADHRVLRGGSWMSIGGHCRSARRHHETPDAAHSDFGFRVVVAPPPEPDPGTPAFVNVFTAGQDGVDTFRIPSLLVAQDAALLAFCEARKESEVDASPTDMVMRRSVDEGQSWQPIQTLVRGAGTEAMMNPCPVLARDSGVIILICTNANKLSPGHNELYQLISADNGQTWDGPVNLRNRIQNFDDTFNPGPGVGIQLQNGRLLVPGYVGGVSAETDETFYSCAMYSDDHGATWTMGAHVKALSDESQALELRDGRLMLNMRGNMGMSCRGVALSDDGGATWSPVRWDRALNECPCQASIARHNLDGPDARSVILFANPDNYGERFNVVERTAMTVRVSYDDGATWPVKRLIHHGPAAYSGLVRLPSGEIGLIFEGGEKHRREWIRFARFSLAWLTGGNDTP